MTDRLFGYGAILDWRAYGVGHPARLDAYELGFNGFATVRFRGQDSAAYGVLLDVDEQALRRFDFMEGFRGHDDPSNYYDRVRVNVMDLDRDELVRAWVYVMRETRPFVTGGGWTVTGGYRPSYGYVQLMRDGYAHYGLPVDELDAALARDATDVFA